MSYQVMSVEDFGAAMLRTGDLDPIYVMLNAAQLDPETRARWCLAYWCFYHAGFASYAADQQYNGDFWVTMVQAARNEDECEFTKDKRWPRGTERRHYRGKASINSMYWLRDHYNDATDALNFVSGAATGMAAPTFWTVRERVMTWPAFGPWIAFKVADMLDAVMGVPVDFTGTEKAFFDDPKEGARIVAERWGQPMATLENVVFALRQHFASTPVPHAGRNVRTQEVETILCKYKSHTRGSYPVGKDTDEILHGLVPWLPHSKTAVVCHKALDEHARLRSVRSAAVAHQGAPSA